MDIVIVIVLAFFVILLFLLATFIIALGVGLISWVLTLIFPMSMLEAIIVTAATGLGAGYALYHIITYVALLASPSLDQEIEDDDIDDEPDEPPIVPWRRKRPVRASPPNAEPKKK